ncbi:MAG TPA: DinB family protein [Planctomycetota bacterium]|nr:DinB family protein [Planctomycetota bacterium]
MHVRTRELLAHLEQHRDTLRAAVHATSPPLRDRKPAPDRWSAAEVLEHLGLVESQVAVLLRRGLRSAQAGGPLPRAAAHVHARTIDERQLLDRERVLRAGAGVAPGKGLTSDAAWQALETSRAALHAVVLAADGLATDTVRAPHPFFGDLDFDQWVRFVGLHEARHAAQIRATTASLLAD